MAAQPPRADTLDSAADTLSQVSDSAVTRERFAVSAVAPTLAISVVESEPGAVDPRLDSFAPSQGATRYEARRLLGEGGMGEVRLCKDAWIGREVAMKVVHRSRGSRADLRARFLREVRVQGQLEHPSILPVYDLGVSAEGETFFTMKRVKGLALDAIVDGLRAGDPELTAAFTRRKILSAMSRVCLAIAFAHSRGAIHRDLKPANVMLGDFGEVYVLDWGIAKVVGSGDDEPMTASLENAGAHGPRTEAGAVLGTPGYMSPEQVRGDPGLDARSDVYALGAILFEVLALEPLHDGRSAGAAMASTIAGGPTRPSARAPAAEIPPELDALCERALALDPAQRFASARELSEAIEAFLDGERDTERRRELAERHVENARAALARATEEGSGAHAHRTDATRELGRALALDPTNQGAMAELMKILLVAPTELPLEGETELAEVNRSHRARSAKATAVQFLAWYLATPLIFWLGVRNWWCMAALDLLMAGVIGYSWWMGKTGKAQPRYMVFAIPLTFTAMALLSMFFGPFVVLPGAVAVCATMFLVSLRPNLATRRMILGHSIAAVGVPLVLQWTGVVPSSYSFHEGVITILPTLTFFPALPTVVFLVALSLGVPLVANLMVGRAVEQLARAERRAFAQAFRLRQLLPAGEAGVVGLGADPETERCISI